MQPDGTCGLSYSKFHVHAMESASPAAVHSARFGEISTPPADSHVPDCTIWYDSPETVAASVESTSHASFAGAVPVALTRGRQLWRRTTGVRAPTTSMPGSANAIINAQPGTARKCQGRRDYSPQVRASLNFIATRRGAVGRYERT